MYRVERLIHSLRTKCDRKAKSQALAMLLKLEDHWSKARLHNDVLHRKSLNHNKAIKFTESMITMATEVGVPKIDLDKMTMLMGKIK